MSTEAKSCPRCGARLIGDALEGLCPRCLLLARDAADSASDVTMGDGGQLGALDANLKADRSPAPGIPPRSTASIGERIKYFGDYELIEEIARGGMGIVYKARQVSLNRVVALKMILTGQLASEADVQRFLVEAQAAANLDHPHIVPIYEVGQHNGLHYFSMKLIDGKGLNRNLAAYADDSKAAARLLAKVAKAVHHAHQRGILHRDLKPGNILLDQQGEPHVTDFGLAKRVEEDSKLTQSGAVMGTPAYMAPEQAGASKDLTVAADVWGLGAVLYELLTGRPPFHAPTPLETMRQVIDREPARPTSICGRLDSDLETVCLKCLEKDPVKRYATSAALAEDLERWLAGEPIAARPIGQAERTWRWCKRNPAVATLTAAIGMAVIALIVLAGVSWRNAAQRAVAVKDLGQAQREIEGKRAEVRALEEARRLQQQAITIAQSESRRRFYRSDVQLAAKSIAREDIGGALRLLSPYKDQQFNDLRGMEWNCLWNQCQGPSKLLLPAGAGAVAMLAVSPDGTRVAVIRGGDGRVIVVDAASGKEVANIASGQTSAGSLAFSPDSKSILVITGKSADGRPQQDLTSLDDLLGLIEVKRYSIGGDAEGASEMCTPAALAEPVQNLRDFTIRLPWGTVRSTTVVASRDGKMLACGGVGIPAHRTATGPNQSQAVLALWEPRSGRNPRILSCPPGAAVWLSFSVDGRILAGLGVDRAMTFWNVDGGEQRISLPRAGMPESRPAMSVKTGMMANRVVEGELGLRELNSGLITRLLRIGHTRFNAIAFSPSGDALITGATDGSVRMWRLDAQETIAQHTVPAFSISSLAFQADGMIRAGDSATSVRMLDGQSLSERSSSQPVAAAGTKEPVPSDISYSPDGSRVAIRNSSGVIEIWDTRTTKLLSKPDSIEGNVYHHAFSSDGRLLLSLSVPEDKHALLLNVWDVASGRRQFSKSLPFGLGANALFLKDDQRVLVAWVTKDGGTLQVCRLADQTSFDIQFASSERGAVHAMALDVEGKKLAIAVGDGEKELLHVFDIAGRRAILPPIPQTSEVSCIAFSADGGRLVLGCTRSEAYAGTIVFLDAGNGEEMLSFEAPAAVVSHIALRADGRKLAASVSQFSQATGTGEGQIYMWDLSAPSD